VSVDITFRQLISPIAPEEFFGDIWEQRAVHIPGAADKFASVCSWDEFNRFLNMSKLWTERSMKLVLDGEDVAPAEYGHIGRSREGYQAIVPDAQQVASLLRRGATVTLDLIETLSPGIAAVSAALQTATGGVAVCNAYCSWRAHQGFAAHFDTTDVIAVHIEGSKRWRIYEGCYENAVDAEGHDYGSFSLEHHAHARGELVEEIEMTPGDVLYVPRGQYHEALASSDASLHLSFGIGQPTGLDVISRLMLSLPDEALFRKNLPHFDRPLAHREHMREIADRLHEVLSQSSLSDQVREWQRERALTESHGRFNLPARDRSTLYRVRSMGVSVGSRDGAPILAFPGGEIALEPGDESATRWIIERDYIDDSELENRFEGLGRDALQSLLGRLEAASVLDRI
jgi:ribosomal protein L16 Arg81 hydroxylase